MPAAARLGDLCLQPPRRTSPAVTASANVRINGRGALRVGDLFVKAPKGLAAVGSKTVRVNGRPLVRRGDALDCRAIVVTGSKNVTVGG